MLGNEAVARGAIEAGVDFCSGYPGTPSTEIMESLIKTADEYGHYAEWSTNEKVALEAAGAAAKAGLRSICTMKCQGMDVASDFLFTTNLAGTKGGFVLAVADDPSAYSTTTEIDTRHYAKMADIPLLEPSSPQEAKEMTKWAFDLSEELGVLVMLRMVMRISHSRGGVRLGEVPKRERKPEFSSDEWYTSYPPTPNHSAIHEKLEKARSIFEESEYNRYVGPDDASFVIITSGTGWFHSLEAVETLGLNNKIGVLKISTSWPLPDGLIKKHLSHAEEVLFVEEIDPFHEENVKSTAGGSMHEFGPIKFYGKRTNHISREGFQPGVGEIDANTVINTLNELMEKSYEARPKEYVSRVKEVTKPLTPSRTPIFCAGCPHRASFWVINRALKWLGKGKIVAGDIGCYSMGLGPTGYFLLNTLHCMGAGVSVAHGFSKLKEFDLDVPIVAFAGDSTFYHACIPGLINAKYNGGDFLFVILDNETTAMTGHQPHPGTGITAMENKTPIIRPEAITRALDIKTVIKDPFEIDDATEAAYQLLQEDGVKALIFRHPCELEESRRRETKIVVSVDKEKCIGEDCGCVKFMSSTFNCPGIVWNPKEETCEIDESICTGCGLCADICPGGAIEIKEIPK